jgi:hypothetical protein
MDDKLLSPEYREQLQFMHLCAERNWGSSGHAWAGRVKALAHHVQARSILDYGSGAGTLKPLLFGFNVSEYDPGIPGKDNPPEPADLIVCTDVMEHIEPECLESVIAHIHQLTKRAAFFVIATREAHAILPDGRNAHLIVRRGKWWIKMLRRWRWRLAVRSLEDGEVLIVAYK